MDAVTAKVERLLLEAEEAAQRKLNGGGVSPSRSSLLMPMSAPIVTATDDTRELVKRLCDKEDRVGRAEAQVEMLKHALDAQEVTIRTLQEEASQRAETTRQLVADYEFRIEQSSRDLQGYQRKASELASANTPQLLELHTLRLEASQLTQELNGARGTHTAEIIAKDNQIAVLESDVAALRDATRGLESQLENATSRCQTLEIAHNTMKFEQSVAPPPAPVAIHDQQNFDAKNVKLQGVVSRLKGELEKARFEAASWEKKCVRLGEEVKGGGILQRKNAKLEAVNQNLKEAIRKVTEESEVAMSTIQRKNGAEAEEALRVKLNELTRAITEQKQACEFYWNSKNGMEAENRELHEQLVNANTTIAHLMTDLEKYTKENYHLRGETGNTLMVTNELSRALESRSIAERGLIGRTEEISRLNKEIDTLRVELTSSQAEGEALKQANEQSYAVVSTLRDEIVHERSRGVGIGSGSDADVRHLEHTLVTLANAIHEQETVYKTRLAAYRDEIVLLETAMENKEVPPPREVEAAVPPQSGMLKAAEAKLVKAEGEILGLKGRVSELEGQEVEATEAAASYTKVVSSNSKLLRSVWDVASSLSTARETLVEAIEASSEPSCASTLQTALKAVNSARTLAQEAAASSGQTS